MNPTQIDRRDFVRWCGGTALLAASYIDAWLTQPGRFLTRSPSPADVAR